MGTASHQLLLLPSPPSELSDATLEAAYGPAIRGLLASPQVRSTSTTIVLDIAVQLPRTARPEKHLFHQYQTLLAGLYRLLIQSSEHQHLPDVAIVFLDQAVDKEKTSAQRKFEAGPVVPLDILASSQRPWETVHGVDGEAGELLLQNFIHHRRSLPNAERYPRFETRRLEGGSCIQVASDQPSHGNAPEHSSVAVGGTFDHLHIGHKLLLTATALVVESAESMGSRQRSLTVGISGKALLRNKKYPEQLESFEKRQQNVYDFLSRILFFDSNLKPTIRRLTEPGPNGTAVQYTVKDIVVTCVALSDAFGPTITNPDITALVISTETRAGGKAVNDKRTEKNWAPLEIFEVDVLDTKPRAEMEATGAFETKISSTEIRRLASLEEGSS